MTDSPPAQRKSRWRLWLYLAAGIPLVLWILLFSLLPALGVCRIFRIPTQNMAPTLEPGDWLLSNEMAYQSMEPARGDVVVMQTTGIEGLAPGQSYCKRVLAVPGDVLTVVEGLILVNGKEVHDPAGTPYRTMFVPAGMANSGLTHDGDSITVPSGSVFLVGDNANNSFDSRAFGGVPITNITGKAGLRVWPFSRIGGL